MSIVEILDTLLLKPLQLIFEIIYMNADKVADNPGVSIIVLSLFVNLLALPLYMRADAIQEEERAVEKKLQKGVEHIKKTFHGDERMMMLQTYYRQNHYKPVYVLRSAVSLFLQIPFFIAAYRFLSGLQLINGVPFGPIADLGNPDGLLQIGGMTVNLLPVIMTAVNLISCIVFTKGSPLKSKLQLYAMALFFLVFLYTSPSGLVFYWTLNNIFSLVKTIFYKLKNPEKAIHAVCCAAGGVLIVYGIFFYSYQYNNFLRKAFLAGIGILLQLPLLYGVVRRRIKRKKKEVQAAGNWKVFFSGALFLAVLIGALIPSAVIKSSPQEFAHITSFYHPLWFVVSSFCMAAGFFVFWAGVFYFLAKPPVRLYFDRGVWVISGIAIVDYMFFGKNLGLLSSYLKFENELYFTRKEILGNIIIVLIIVLIFYVFHKKYARLVAEILLTGVFAFLIMTAVNIREINSSISEIQNVEAEETGERPGFTLSRSGENVVVIMLDRAIGGYVPYILQEKPELKEKFSGFTYYPNIVSFGSYTNSSTPSLFGGYEYTPIEMNKRKTESLSEKHDEALKVMPVLFEQNGYAVTVFDPPYTGGYQWTANLSIYDEYPGISSFLTSGKFTDSSAAEQGIENNKRNFFCYGILKTVPVCFQKLVYDQGKYNQAEFEIIYAQQVMDTLYTATGIRGEFMESYNVLAALPDITELVDEETGSFLMMVNDITHDPMLLQEPDYVPAMRINNLEYKDEYPERFTIDGRVLKIETDLHLIHYQANVAAMIQLGKWFDYMRENGVYDNTKIIIVSDHGRDFGQMDELILENGFDIESHYPLLFVKDFNSSGFEISEEFMTCADVPALAVEDVIKEPINPFTGKMLGYGDKSENVQYIIHAEESNVLVNNGNQFLPAQWYTVHDDMRKPENWELKAENAVLPVD